MDKTFHDLPDRESIKAVLIKYREKILSEVQSANNLMSLLMKGAREKWTDREKEEIKGHLLQLGKSIPAVMIFLLPGGFIFLPLLVELLDRRKKNVAVLNERRKGEE